MQCDISTRLRRLSCIQNSRFRLRRVEIAALGCASNCLAPVPCFYLLCVIFGRRDVSRWTARRDVLTEHERESRQKLSALGRVLKREKRLRAHIKNARLECFPLAAAMHFALRFTGCITVRLVTVICSTFLFTIVIIVSTLPALTALHFVSFFIHVNFPYDTAHPIDDRVFSLDHMILIARVFAICT